jgi:hypothetical protein
MGASPGVPLAQYARVQAAIAEPFPLDEVLADFGLKKRVWNRAEKTWGELLATDPTLLDTYRRELDAAVDELARRVRPIDEDPAAWLSFLDAYGREPEPFVWLERHDLGMNDLARLKRQWDRRVAEDAGLAQRLPDLRREAEGRPPPKIVADPRRRPGLKGQPAAGPSNGEAPAPPPALDALTYAALLAELDVWPEHRMAVLKDRGIDEGALAGITSWYSKRFEEVPDERRDFEHLRAHYRERVRRARDAQPNRPAPARPPTAIQSVALELPVMRIPTVDELERTAELGDAASTTLPFREATEEDVERMAAELSLRPSRGNPDPHDATAEAELGRQGSVLPFFRPAEEMLDGTLEVSGAGAAPLPFRPSNAPSTLVSGSAEPKPGSRSGATEDLPQLMSRGAPLPFTTARAIAPASPLLTLEQHASLTVELTVASDRHADVLARYQLTPAEKAAVDAYYRAAMQDPAVHAKWRVACDVYLQWLAAARK